MPLDSTYFTTEEIYDELKITKYASDIFSELCEWSNDNQKIKSGIKFSIISDVDSLNAGFHYESNTVVMYYALIQEIYRNCMLFPLYNAEMSNIDGAEDYVAFLRYLYKSPVLFHTQNGVPIVSEECISSFVREKTKSAIEEYSDLSKDMSFMQESFGNNNTLVRFVMFELILAWAFFHEVSHHFQSHNTLKEGLVGTTSAELNSQNQARETLADLQAMDLTLVYIKRGSVEVDSDTAYLLHCGLNILFYTLHNKGSQLYCKHLKSPGNHPNPVLRAQFMRCAHMAIFINHHDDPTSDSAGHEILGLTVLILKALHCSNAYWCSLPGKQGKNGLSVFMLQSSDSYYDELNEEMVDLVKYMELQHGSVILSKRNLDYGLELISKEVFDDFINIIKNPPKIPF